MAAPRRTERGRFAVRLLQGRWTHRADADPGIGTVDVVATGEPADFVITIG